MSRKIFRQRSIFDLQPLEQRRFLTTASIDVNHVLQIVGTDAAETIFVNGVASGTRVTVTGVPASGTQTQFTIGTGTNQFNKINIVAKGGNDTVTISNNFTYSGGATISGGDGADSITGGKGNDSITGDNQNDVLDGQGGADVMDGGSGMDTANYSARTEAIKVTIDGTANDGNNNGGEGDNVKTEEVWTGAGNDSVIGAINNAFVQNDYAGLGAGNDTAMGGDGNDNLTGGPGIDSLFGQNGNDAIYAQNQDADIVNGGTNSDGSADFDSASLDTVDVVQTSQSSSSAAPGSGTQQSGTGLIDNTSVAGPSASTGPADPSTLDGAYADGAGKLTGPNFNWDAITAATVDSQGRTVVVGYDFRGYGYDFVATRFTSEGALDNSFGYNGEAVVDFGTNFGYGYSDNDMARGVTTDSAGNVYIVGSSDDEVHFKFDNDFGIAKLDFNGNPLWTRQVDIGDSISGSGFNDEARDVVIQADGKIVVAGTHQGGGYGSDSDFAVVRLKTDGTPDTTFNGTGQNVVDFAGNEDIANAVALQTLPGDGVQQRIVVGGSSQEITGRGFGPPDEAVAVARFTSTGALDSSFGTGGRFLQNLAFPSPATNANAQINDLVVKSGTNQIYAVGSFDLYGDSGFIDTEGLLGVLDANATTFSYLGHRNPATNELRYNAAALDPQGRLVVVGTDGNDFEMERITSSLGIDNTFNGGNKVYTPFGEGAIDDALGVRVLGSGKIVVGGSSDNDGDLMAASARYVGSPPVIPNEQDVTGIEDYIPDSDLYNPNPPEPLASHLNDLSAVSRLYVLSQPNHEGQVTINLLPRTNTVTFSCVIDGTGKKMLAVNINGEVLYYDQSTTKLLTINGSDSDDQILASDCCVTIPMIVHGNGGNDVITGGAKNDFLFGDGGNDVIDAGAGSDVESGGTGDDNITGASGNDVLLGGSGADRIVGSAGEDILIAGTTAYDNDLSALQAILGEWTSGSVFSTRVSHLRSGVGPGNSIKLAVGAGATVFDDGAADKLTGSSSQDWFFYRKVSVKDTITDLHSEDLTDLL